MGLRLQDVSSEYTLGKVLGRGQFGTTRLAEDKKSGKVLACKSIAKRKLTCAAAQAAAAAATATRPPPPAPCLPLAPPPSAGRSAARAPQLPRGH